MVDCVNLVEFSNVVSIRLESSTLEGMRPGPRR